ncbi:MAG: ribosome small subunit-dependent GTPase A [Bacteroidetes bacterium]|nr:MAG: ribosome small subunit-dependent GTPase A [Bacteroidota bacterium]
MEGLVEKSTGSWIYVRSREGKRIPCRVKGRFRIEGIRTTNVVAIGDHVEFILLPGGGEGLIHKVLPRNNYIIRKATKLSREAHIIAANLDHAYLIVTLVNPRTSNGFIDRFLVTATGYFIPASLIFNKLDIYEKEVLEWMEELFQIYRKAGYPCYAVSALRGDGVDQIRELLKGKVSLFSGHSGSGKSALIKAIDPTLDPRIGEISEVHLKGRHTTTFAEMYELREGGDIIDTPGIKEFGLVHFDKTEIPRCFPEMDRLLPHCQYSNCTHLHEPGCAVKRAIPTGEVSEIRYNSYLSILNDDTKR